MIVVDASVAAKVYVHETGSNQAVELLTGPRRLVAPSLIRTEVASAICRRVRLKELDAAEALVRCDHWEARLRDDWISLIPNAELIAAACRLATSLQHPLPDCLYLALAQDRELPLVTADRKFFDRAKGAFPAIEMLPGCASN